MKVRIGIFILVLAPSLATAQAPSLTGDWIGESICVGMIGACKDEQVVYHVSISKADPHKLTIAADKIVNGKLEPMGDIDFTYDATNHLLVGEFQNPRNHLRIEYTVKGNTIWGTMMLLPEKRVVRQMRVTKTEAGQPAKMMATHAAGTFEVKLTPQDDKSDDKSIGRMTAEKQWRGDLVGTSAGQMLTGGDVKTGSAGYVAMEKFTGTLQGRQGTFILQHSGTMTAGKGDLIITIVPNSGTDALNGISGKLAIKIENGKHFYDLEYSLPQ